MSIPRVCFCVALLGFVAACEHRGAYKNEFELIAEQDVVPEPVHNSHHSIKDSGLPFGRGEAFSSRETRTWRTRVSHALMRKGIDDWNTDYTHSTNDLIIAKHSSKDPVEIYRRTGQWPLTYHLDTGDRLNVVVYSQRTLSRSYQVDDSGHISVPLVGQVYVRGGTVRDVERRLAKLLADKYLRDPKVSVEVATYRPFFVLGQVQTAGQYPYVVGMTVEMAAAIAGGYSARADEHKFRLSRVYKGRRFTLLVSKNFPLFPGDTLYVRERLF